MGKSAGGGVVVFRTQSQKQQQQSEMGQGGKSQALMQNIIGKTPEEAEEIFEKEDAYKGLNLSLQKSNEQDFIFTQDYVGKIASQSVEERKELSKETKVEYVLGDNTRIHYSDINEYKDARALLDAMKISDKGEGIEEAAQAGILGGFPVLGVKATVWDGSYHEVDSSEMAFKIAGSMAFKEAMRKASPIILEPIMKVCVIAPDDYLGTVIGDLNSRRGQILGQEQRTGAVQVDALVPLSEMFGYSNDLRSKTQGRGQYTMEPDSYIQVPKSISEKIMASRNKD